MARFTIKDVAEIVNGRLYNIGENLIAQGISTDSRTINSGELFFAIKGDSFDGHEFAHTAIEKGGVAVVANKIIEDVPLILVDDTVRALFELAVAHLNEYNPQLVAVTGSYGKTTTKELIHAVLSCKYKTVKAQKSYNNLIGISKTLFCVDEDVEYVVLELGTNHPGEIPFMVEKIKLNTLVVLSVGKTHIGNFGSIEEILREKLSAIDGLVPEGKLLINLDNRYLKTAGIERSFYGFGMSEDAYFRILDVKDKGFDGFCFRVSVSDREKFSVCSPLLGDFNVYNVVAAFSVGWLEDVDVSDMVEAIGRCRNVGNRMDCWRGKGGFYIINDAYNANPDAVRAAIRLLCKLPGSRRILVIGDMLELGKYAEIEHYAVGEYAGRMGVDEVWAIGKFADFVLEGFKREPSENQKAKIFSSNKEIANEIMTYAKRGDIFLIKGSRKCAMEGILEQIGDIFRC